MAEQRSLIAALLALALGLLGGCAVGPNYQRPAQPAPATWRAPASAPGALASVAQTDDAAALERWWTWFEDPVLDALVDQALGTGFDVRGAEARLRAARAERRAAQAGFGPQLGVGVSSNRLQNPMPGLAPGVTFTLHEVGFDARWEIDLFGRQRRRVEAADAAVAASAEDIRAARTVLCAEVARAYWEYRAATRQAALLDRALEMDGDDARRAQALVAAGLVARDQALAAAGQVDRHRAQRAALVYAQGAAQRQLERLLAVAPGRLDTALSGSSPPLPQLAPRLLLTPAAVLRQRPDIQRAERQLAAATAMQGAALADMYPRVSLAVFFGLRNTALSALTSLASKSWSGGGSVLQPLFDAGRLRAAVDVRNADAEAALVDYERVSLDALHDTEDALARWLAAEQQRDALVAALAERQSAATLAHHRLAQGVGSARAALATDIAALMAEVEAEGDAATLTVATVAVFKALGAGIPPAFEASGGVAQAVEAEPSRP